MATRRLADRQIRAAAQAALRLDVRGPVSEALGQTGIAVPPAGEGPAASTAPPASTPSRTVGRAPRRKKGLAPTVKPFAEAPWPTRKPAPADPLSGLTADERRVHRILLDALDLTARQGDLGRGAGYAERQRLEALDLAFINAQLAKMAEGPAATGRPLIVAGALILGFGVALSLGAPALVAALLGTALIVAGALVATGSRSRARGPQRQKIYEALRELALLVEPAPASTAVAEADRIIDRLAVADLGEPEPHRAPAARLRTR